MDPQHRALLLLLLGAAVSTQNHLAKALERQGIDALRQLGARLGGKKAPAGGGRKPLIYTLGLLLNHTTFLYHLLVSPLGGNTALYTSMYGVGLVALLAYARWVIGEESSRQETAGALLVLAGTLLVGLEGLSRPAQPMSGILFQEMAPVLVVLLAAVGALVYFGVSQSDLTLVSLVFGLGAGICGSLDPFLKSVGQAAGGAGKFIPGTGEGWLLLAFSFLIGEAAVVLTQWGYLRGARANLLVPALNCSYIATPVLLQLLLLPGYTLSAGSGAGLALIGAGILLLRGLGQALALPRKS